MATSSPITGYDIATYVEHSDWFVAARPTEALAASQTKRIKAETMVHAQAWTLLGSAAYTATPANAYYSGGTFYALPAWVADTVTALGDYVRPTSANGYVYECVARSGDFKTHATTEPVWPTTLGADIVDDAVTWRCRGPFVLATIEDMTGSIQPGTPLRYVYDSVTYYGMCIGITSSYLALCGAPLSTSHSLTALYYGRADRVIPVTLAKVADYDGGVADVACDAEQRWLLGDGYLVMFAVKHKTDDTGADQPYLNLEIAGSVVSTNGDGTNPDMGIQVSTSWQDNSPTAIKVAKYKVEYGDEITPTLTATGSNGDAAGLSLVAAFVLE